MNIKAMIAPFLVGAGLGAIALATVGGFMSGGSASELAEKKAEDMAGVMAPAYVANCVAAGNADVAGLATLKAETSPYRHRGIVEKTDWVSLPDGVPTSVSRSIHEDCAKELLAS